MLTESQRTTLAAHIRANTDQDVIDALAARNDTELARLYNLDSTFVVWKKSFTPEEYKEQIVWTEVDSLTIGKARIWEWVTGNQTLDIDATMSNIRQGIADAWQGTSTLSNLSSAAKRFSTIAESIFATGTGTNQNPGVSVINKVTITDIGKALNENP